jgi:hypothetical protein
MFDGLNRVLCQVDAIFRPMITILWQIYVPSQGDLTLHFSNKCINQSGEKSDCQDKPIWGIINPQNEVKPSGINADHSAGEDRNITVKAFSMEGCTLFPGSTVSFQHFLYFQKLDQTGFGFMCD